MPRFPIVWLRSARISGVAALWKKLADVLRHSWLSRVLTESIVMNLVYFARSAHKGATSVIISCVCFLGATSESIALTCNPFSIDERVARADVVFVGEVVEEEHIYNFPGSQSSIEQAITLKALALIKGEVTDGEVRVWMPSDTSVGSMPAAKAGSTWLVFGYERVARTGDTWPEVDLSTSTLCTPTFPIAYSPSLLNYLLKNYETVIFGSDPYWKSLIRLGNSYAISENAGLFYIHSSNWVAHDTLGWVWFCDCGDSEGDWAYSPSQGWLWITWDNYPWVYRSRDEAWIYYRGYSLQESYWISYIYNQKDNSWEQQFRSADYWSIDWPFLN